MLIKKHLLSFFVINILLLTNNHNILTVEAQKSSKTPPLPPSSSSPPPPPPPAATTTSATSATSTTTTTDTHLIPETPKISSKEIIANVPYATTQCTIDDNGPCVLANSTLIRCNGVLKTPDQYINQNTFNGTYQPDQKSLASCVCNLEFYNQLSSCIECFNNYTQTKFEVAPLDSFKSTCQSFKTQFTDVPPDEIKTGIPLRVKVGVGVVVAIILVIISGVILYKCCCGREGKKSIKKVDSMKSLTLLSNDEPLMNKSTSSINKSAYYPPPQSQTNLEYQSSTPQQPSSPTKTGYQQQQQQQTYYPMSSNKSISNVQIPTQSISGEISYYPPPGSSSDSSRYSGPQNNNNNNNNFSNDYYGNNRQY